MESKYIAVIVIVAFLAYSAYTTTVFDLIFYIAFILLGVYLGQEFVQIPNIRSIIEKNQKTLQ